MEFSTIVVIAIFVVYAIGFLVYFIKNSLDLFPCIREKSQKGSYFVAVFLSIGFVLITLLWFVDLFVNVFEILPRTIKELSLRDEKQLAINKEDL